MSKNEGLMIIEEVSNNPEILSIIPYEILLLKFLRLTKNNDIRNFLLENKKMKMVPLGFISKILEISNKNFIHIFKLHKNHYYINNDYYDYIIENDEIKTKLNDTYKKLSIRDIHDINRKLINNSPDMIIVQDEAACECDTAIMNQIISNIDMEDMSNLKTYDKNNFDNLNGNTYNLDIVVMNDNKVYFNSNGKKYLYSNGILKETDWDISSFSKTPLISIYNKMDTGIKSKIPTKLSKIKSISKKKSFPKIDLLANLLKRADEDKKKFEFKF